MVRILICLLLVLWCCGGCSTVFRTEGAWSAIDEIILEPSVVHAGEWVAVQVVGREHRIDPLGVNTNYYLAASAGEIYDIRPIEPVMYPGKPVSEVIESRSSSDGGRGRFWWRTPMVAQQVTLTAEFGSAVHVIEVEVLP